MYNVLNHLQEDHIDMLLFEICKYTSMHRVKKFNVRYGIMAKLISQTLYNSLTWSVLA